MIILTLPASNFVQGVVRPREESLDNVSGGEVFVPVRVDGVLSNGVEATILPDAATKLLTLAIGVVVGLTMAVGFAVAAFSFALSKVDFNSAISAESRSLLRDTEAPATFAFAAEAATPAPEVLPREYLAAETGVCAVDLTALPGVTTEGFTDEFQAAIGVSVFLLQLAVRLGVILKAGF